MGIFIPCIADNNYDYTVLWYKWIVEGKQSGNVEEEEEEGLKQWIVDGRTMMKTSFEK